MLSLWRRHDSKCAHKLKGRAYIKCQCPIWCDGEIDGERIRQSLATRDWGRAGRKLAALEDQLNAKAEGRAEPEDRRKPVSDATAMFIALHHVEPSTMRKYRRIMDRLTAFAKLHGIAFIDQFTLDHLDEYKLTDDSAPCSGRKNCSCCERSLSSAWTATGSKRVRPRR